ncbi:hypothetical protein CKAH01_04109 [Colletotrichum kahawae]|uniref:Uncharacterized protein n=1 Tax=Colletotrichum kahawae TaxID=34407 RepID=A0AAD9YMQ0_COLKA|nr:hypothetical protein CKAH01_04109 [Colletotrichum kahawae]
MKRRDGGAVRPFDAAVIPSRLPRRQSLLEGFWKPSPAGLVPIFQFPAFMHGPSPLPTHPAFVPG